MYQELHENLVSSFSKIYSKYPIIDNEFNSSIINFEYQYKLAIKQIEYIYNFYCNNVFNPFIKQYNEMILEFDPNINLEKLYDLHNFTDEINLQIYVLIYHKVENFEKTLVDLINPMINKPTLNLKDLSINLGDKFLFQSRNKFRVISNCIKHNKYYPNEELLMLFNNLQKSEKIKFKDFNIESDINEILNHIKKLHIITLFNLIKFSIVENESYFEDYFKANFDKLDETFNNWRYHPTNCVS